MKKLSLLLFLVLAPWLTLRAESCLMLELLDGTTHSYVLSQQPRITFGDGTLVMHSDEAEATFSLADVAKFYFAAQEDGIPSISAEELRFTFVDGILCVDGPHPAVMLSNLSGQVLKTAPAGAAFTFDLRSQPAGTYLLRIGQQTIKLYNK